MRTRRVTVRSDTRIDAFTHPRTDTCPSSPNTSRRSARATIDAATASSLRIVRSTSPNRAANPRPSNPSKPSPNRATATSTASSYPSPPPGTDDLNELTYPSMNKGCHIEVGLENTKESACAPTPALNEPCPNSLRSAPNDASKCPLASRVRLHRVAGLVARRPRR